MAITRRRRLPLTRKTNRGGNLRAITILFSVVTVTSAATAALILPPERHG